MRSLKISQVISAWIVISIVLFLHGCTGKTYSHLDFQMPLPEKIKNGKIEVFFKPVSFKKVDSDTYSSFFNVNLIYESKYREDLLNIGNIHLISIHGNIIFNRNNLKIIANNPNSSLSKDKFRGVVNFGEYNLEHVNHELIISGGNFDRNVIFPLKPIKSTMIPSR